MACHDRMRLAWQVSRHPGRGKNQATVANQNEAATPDTPVSALSSQAPTANVSARPCPDHNNGQPRPHTTCPARQDSNSLTCRVPSSKFPANRPARKPALQSTCHGPEIGRATCQERGGTYVEIRGVGG